jgi:hypothetical protein
MEGKEPPEYYENGETIKVIFYPHDGVLCGALWQAIRTKYQGDGTPADGSPIYASGDVCA